ncbi:ATP-dependent nuclease [Sediminibacterium ginsengisoli]|uniref:Putative ATP-dependent endonuclease of the OLD family n=1 Tax=Sediminibacterium ginsengisoli TaxID=413434 RepID=A0A1T4NF86_9BACT|nr:AAA family ATPase [Sediminibacterium ginsengisoli]SJZ77930.1 putative ATP-dependent endonuclease of the OLD family [Sediminibacterium ginsengisoli]
MRIAYIDIQNFRGIKKGHIKFDGHSVLIGDNNTGKSTVFEAIDLVLGPDRLSRVPVVDEHDFYNGIYLNEGQPVPITIEVLVIDLTDEQKRRFFNNLEFWDFANDKLIIESELDATNRTHVKECLRLRFIGKYDETEDDFNGETHFCWPEREDSQFSKFGKFDKRECGFLYLRALRTGARALSLERGTLLDIILRIREQRPQMWEDVLSKLREDSTADDTATEVKDILTGIQEALKKFVPVEWGAEPHLRVTDLTREHLRKTLTVFMSTGTSGYHAPYNHQGTGTVNTMVLALLSMIAEAKKTVIFAMEEPEIAIPPYTQKRIVDHIRKHSTQAIFTSHSPFVLEEFSTSNILLLKRDGDGELACHSVKLPSIIKPKAYSREFRTRFSEALLASRVLLCEGDTEVSSYSQAARRLNDLQPSLFDSLEGLGIAIFDAESESNIPAFGDYFRSLGKTVFAVYDKQDAENSAKCSSAVTHPFESTYKGFEKLVLEETAPEAIKAFALDLASSWPQHLDDVKPVEGMTDEQYKNSLFDYFKKYKGSKSCAALLISCTVDQMPKSVKNNLQQIGAICNPSNTTTDGDATN